MKEWYSTTILHYIQKLTQNALKIWNYRTPRRKHKLSDIGLGNDFFFLHQKAKVIAKNKNKPKQRNKKQTSWKIGRGSEETFFQRIHTNGHLVHKKLLNIIIITEMQSRTTKRHYLTPVRMTVMKKIRNNKCWQGLEKREPLCTVGWNVSWCSHYEKQCGGSWKNLRIELTFDIEIPLLVIY